MTTQHRYQLGEKVRHIRRPEWGVGLITRTETMPVNGTTTQRLSIRFPNGGMKTLVVAQTELEHVAEESANDMPHANEHPLASFETLSRSDWLAPHARKKIEQAMISMPMEARDPFSSLKRRLAFTLDLYRFEKSGRTLMDWAVAQSGQDDPLSTFTRHDLEHLFDRYAQEREGHLARVLAEARTQPELVRELLKTAPPAARDAVKRHSGSR